MAGTYRRGQRHTARETRECAVLRLLELRARSEFRSEHVRLVAEQLGIGEGTVWRWLKAGRVEGRTARKAGVRLEVTHDDVVELAYHCGNIAAFHRARRAAGATLGVGAWRRAFARALSPGRHAGIREGERARRDFDTYLTRQPRFRNECWEADHTQLAVKVVLPDRRLVKPWATIFVDTYSRAITGWAIAVTPSQESVLSGLRTAISTEAPHGQMGGIPMAIRFDQGKEFLARAVRVATAGLVIDVRPQPGYTPHLKGSIERLNETVEQLVLRELPGFLHGATDRTGRPVDTAAQLLRFECLVELFDAFVRWYNVEHPHDGLNGRTPREMWDADPTPIQTVPDARLRHLMLASVTRVVTKRGVRVDGRVYNCAELCGHIGDEVEVRYLPHHDGVVEVFLNGAHLGTAQLVDRLSAAEMDRVLEHRAGEAKWLASVQRAAARRRRSRYAAMTEPGPMHMASAFVERDADLGVMGDDSPSMQLKASRSLAVARTVPDRMVRPRVIRGGAR
jgi:putative transposase